MANSEFIEILSPSALKDLREANIEVVKLVANIDKVGQNMAKISTPSGADNATKKLVNDYQNLEKQLQKTQQQLEKQRLSEIKLQQAREKAFDKYEAQLQREQAKLNASQNLYNKVQAKLNALSNEYKALAVQKELTGKLTDAESKRYDFLQAKITKYDTTLKAVDATMGKYQRNVGNYASGFNSLSNSINQLTREAPAFANSVQTGFMAISNNLPIFFDAIQSTKAELQALKAQGQEVPSLFKSIANSFFTWGTALSIGVTLLTVFGDNIVDAIFSTKAKAKADEEAQKVIEAKNKAEQEYIDTIRNSASEEISKARLLFENAKNQNIPLNERIAYIKQLRETYPKYLKDLSDQDILAGNTAKSEELLNQALMKRGIAIALQDKISEAYKKVADAMVIINQAQTNQSTIDEKAIKSAMAMGVSRQQAIKDINLLNILAIRKAELDKKNAEAEINNLVELYNKYAPYLEVVNKNTEATKKNTEEKKKSFEFLSKTDFENAFKLLEEEISLISALNPNYEVLNKTLQSLKQTYEELYGSVKKQTDANDELVKGIEIADEQLYEEYFAWLKLKDATDEYIKTITSNAFNQAFDNIGLSSAKMFLDFDENGKSTFDKLIEGADTVKEKFAVTFQAVGDVAQEVFGMMQNLSNQRLEQQLANLEKERDIAIAFAGESTTARQEIEEQYNQRKRKLQRQQAEQQKKLAVFNILINTAQGVVSALASTPPNVPLSIAIGVIGALQAGIVASQQIPAFAKGTDNAPEGWALTQEQGREIITDKYGKIKSLGSDKGAQYTYLNKGDKVFKNADTEAMLFNSNLNNMLLGNGIAMPKVEVSLDAEKITNEIKSLANTIANKEGLTIVKDERGERKFIRKQNETKELLNNVLTYKGIDV